MNMPKFFITILIFITFTLGVVAEASKTTTTFLVEMAKVEGGPRTVIQAMTDIVVHQPTATNLYITIVDSNGNVVIKTATQEKKTVISAAGLSKGTYIVETVDDHGDYQEFPITID